MENNKNKRLFNIDSESAKKGIFNKAISGQGANGKNISPQLKWNKIKGAKSYVITMVDYEAANVIGTPFIHWLGANIKTNEIKENVAVSKEFIQGKNSLSSPLLASFNDTSNNPGRGIGYIGPTPPDQAHNYEINVYALNVEKLNLEDKQFYLGDLKRAMQGKIIATESKTFLAHTAASDQEKYTEFYYDPNNVVPIEIFSETTCDKDYLFREHIHAPDATSPHLSWTKVDNSQYYTVVMYDDEATNVTGGLSFIHWLATGIQQNELQINATELLKDTLIQGDSSATKNFEFTGAGAPIIPAMFLVDKANRYFGPMPPDREHAYTFKIYAHREALNLRNGFKYGDLSRELHGKVIGEGQIDFKAKKWEAELT